MTKKTFIVTHAKARAPLTITGNTMKDALEKEGLDPDIWKLADTTVILVTGDNGDSEDHAGHEDS